jgi:hypothetical protein
VSNSNVHNTLPLVLLALLASLIIWLATRFGIGVTPDSTVYLDSAHNLLNGRGLIALTARGDFQPLTHYPPFYPAVLALLARLGSVFGGFPVETAARALFGANVLLVGIAIRNHARDSYWLPIVASALTLTAPDIVGIHAFALSEGMFIFLLLSGLVSLDRFGETKRRHWLICSSTLVAMAFLTRYVGVTLVFTGVLILSFVNRRTFRHRCFDALTFGLISCAPVALWACRNMRIGAGVSDREFVFHPIGLRQITAGLSTVSTWLLLGKVRTDFRVIVFVFEMAAASLLVIYLLRFSRNAGLNPAQHDEATSTTELRSSEQRGPSRAPIIFLVFIVCYVAFLLFTGSFIDADTVLDDRASAPVHVAAIVVGCSFAWKLLRLPHQRRPIQIGAAALAIILLSTYSIRAARWLIQARRDGQGYASRAWKESKIIAHVKNTSAGLPVYSNAYEAVYYLTGRPAIYIPEKVIHGTGRENQNYAAEVESMRTALKERGGLLVYFDTLPERWFLPSKTDLVNQLSLTEIMTTPDGSIYKLNANSANRGEIEPSR